MQDKKKRKRMHGLRRFIAKMVMGIGGFYAAIDPETMDEIVSEMQAMNKITHPGTMPDYEQLKKIENEWVERKIIG